MKEGPAIFQMSAHSTIAGETPALQELAFDFPLLSLSPEK